MTKPTPDHDIDHIRSDIDRVDDQILRLLAERRAYSAHMALVKGAGGRIARDPAREEDVIADRIAAGLDHDLDSGLVNSVWRTIIDDSVRIQHEHLGSVEDALGVMTVAIQGIEGSYSHLAAQQHVASKGAEALYVPCDTFADAIGAVVSGAAATAVLPIENTTSGAITEVYDLLLASKLHVVGDIRLRVRHCLVGVPGAKASGVRRVLCHPQTVLQCSHFLSGLDNVELVYHLDTAMSVRDVAALGDPTVAAIASKEAAKEFGLEALKSGIANQDENTTRFVVASAMAEPVPDGVPAKTSVVMAVGNHPGALIDALAVFRAADINLVKLESRPIPHNPREELFYLDFEGRATDPKVAVVLDDLTRQVRFLRILGSYPSRDLRPTPVRRRAKREKPDRLVADAPVPAARGGSGHMLGSRHHKVENTVVEVGGVRIGGDDLVVMAGPCAVESWDQVMTAAKVVKEAGGTILRGGCFKPRTSPYSFQGLGYEGLEMLVEAGRAFGLPVVTEVLSPEDVPEVARRADILQIGTRNMQNFSLLSAVGRVHRPVMLKRGMSSSLEELLHAAEYILNQGNQQVLLCERGIRTFETSTRNTLDLSAIPVLRSRTHLPVVVDPSHAAGIRELVAPLAVAGAAIGAHALMIEIHPDPDSALSDGPQSLHLEEYADLMATLGFVPASSE